jgi:hypothetical protein
MQVMIGSGTRTINRLSGRSGRAFGARYFQSLVESPGYFANAYKYVYRNPVRAALSQNVEHYRYSTWQGLTGASPLPVPLYFPFNRNDFLLIPEELDQQLDWLNHPFRVEHEDAIRNGLRRTVFAPPRIGWKRMLSELNDRAL